jgi:hypothetical protein
MGRGEVESKGQREREGERECVCVSTRLYLIPYSVSKHVKDTLLSS